MNTIRSVEVEEYDRNNKRAGTTLSEPTWEQFLGAREAVQKRGNQLAGVSITAENGSFLYALGSDGLYFALHHTADGSQYQPLPDPARSGEEVTILISGAATTLPRAFLFDEPTLLRVLWDFWQGRLDVSTGWEPL